MLHTGNLKKTKDLQAKKTCEEDVSNFNFKISHHGTVLMNIDVLQIIKKYLKKMSIILPKFLSFITLFSCKIMELIVSISIDNGIMIKDIKMYIFKD